MWLFLWETTSGERKWEAVRKNQVTGFLKKLIQSDALLPTIMATIPLTIHWVWPEYHEGISEVNFRKINEEICGTDPIKSNHSPLNVPIEKPKPVTKWGWLAPDGRFFRCDYGEHSHLATKIVGDIEKIANPERHLEEMGWAKILSGVAGKRYAIGMGIDKKLTDKQLKTLQDMDLDKAYGISYFL